MRTRLTCFLACSAQYDCTYIKNLLKEFDVEFKSIDNLSYNYNSGKALTKIIDACSFLVAVITENNANIFYEIGYAHGSKKPVFLIFKKDINIPFDLIGTVSVRSDFNTESAIRFPLEQFIKNLPARTNKNIIKRNSKIQINDLENTINELENIREQKNGNLLFEEIMYNTFVRLNLGVVERNQKNEDKEIDIAVWADEVENELGNPIIMELKYGNLSENTLSNAENQISHYLENSNAKTGIVLYLDAKNRRFKNGFISPNIFRIEATELIRSLFNKSFGQILLEYRNKAVHHEGAN